VSALRNGAVSLTGLLTTGLKREDIILGAGAHVRHISTHKWRLWETLNVGIREKLARYLSETEVPVAITRHGDTIGYYIFRRVASVARLSVRHSKKPLFVCSKC
jgi:hypothetical protein